MDSHAAITNLVTAMLYAVDVLDWPGARGAFADDVETDYTSFLGGKPARVSADQLVANWKGLLPGFDFTQHLTGPLVVADQGTDASAETHLRAYHLLKGAPGGESWTLVGHYTFGLRLTAGAGWRISAMKLTVFHQEGNLNLPALAQKRAAASPRR